MTAEPANPPRKNNNSAGGLLVNLALNVILPSVILAKMSTPERLGPTWSLVVALLFPIGYGLWDLFANGNRNLFSLIGLISILLTGGLGLLQIGGFWFAVKEAALPLAIGIAVIASTGTKRPLVRTFLFNDQVINVSAVEAALEQNGNRGDFEFLLKRANWWLASSFFVSAALNFGLAMWILKSPAGTPEFNAELGKMTALSWVVITVPTMAILFYALFNLIKGVRHLTGLDDDHIFHGK